MRNSFVYALHKTGLHRIVEECRDYIEWVQSGRQDSFSQFGEDLYLKERFNGRTGFYIDIGGNHPIRGNNTYSLYRQGWEGLVVEPIKRFHAKQERIRPRDIQVNAAVGNSSGTLTFYELIPSVLSTCDTDAARNIVATGQGLMLREYSVPVKTVAELYREYMDTRQVSLLCIDTEGFDLAVLQGVDWAAMRPEVVVCEANEEDQEIEIKQFLTPFGYSCVKSLGGSRVFVLS